MITFFRFFSHRGQIREKDREKENRQNESETIVQVDFFFSFRKRNAMSILDRSAFLRIFYLIPSRLSFDLRTNVRRTQGWKEKHTKKNEKKGEWIIYA